MHGTRTQRRKEVSWKHETIIAADRSRYTRMSIEGTPPVPDKRGRDTVRILDQGLPWVRP